MSGIASKFVRGLIENNRLRTAASSQFRNFTSNTPDNNSEELINAELKALKENERSAQQTKKKLPKYSSITDPVVYEVWEETVNNPDWDGDPQKGGHGLPGYNFVKGSGLYETIKNIREQLTDAHTTQIGNEPPKTLQK